MKKAENIIVGISIGDLNGIGSEVVLGIRGYAHARVMHTCYLC
jgi:4-hydroxythreonine-4-phosphate dehydrogenase